MSIATVALKAFHIKMCFANSCRAIVKFGVLGLSSGGPVWVCWLDAVDKIDAFADFGEMSEAAQFAPACFCAVGELEKHVQQSVAGQTTVLANIHLDQAGEGNIYPNVRIKAQEFCVRKISLEKRESRNADILI